MVTSVASAAATKRIACSACETQALSRLMPKCDVISDVVQDEKQIVAKSISGYHFRIKPFTFAPMTIVV